MPITYEPWLVLLSVVMAIQGAYVGLGLAVHVGEATGARQRFLLAGAAFSLAIAIWAMHFVGMLAARVPFPVDYLVLPTLLSFLVCVIVVGAAVYATSSGPLTLLRLSLSATLMGAGIFSMHYIGMAALHASAHMIHAPLYVAASMAVAIGASGLALWLATGRGGRPPLILSASAFGVAVSGMHYTAMAGLSVLPHAGVSTSAPALSTDLLAIVVAVVAFCVSGMFLLFLVPERARAPAVPAADPPPAAEGVAEPVQAEIGSGSYAPLGGAGGPPRRFVRHLPIERDGATHHVAVEAIVAVHANAHYTTIFDGTSKFFCPLPIGDVEARLDTSRFVRVHRSHIVNIERVVRLKRAGDSGLVELDASGRYPVPVSRSRVSRLKSRINGRSAEVLQQA
ncbi:MAG: MHYT domain-containing protein [Alphaproteobacteria bacterium]